MKILQKTEGEIHRYYFGETEISDGVFKSEYKTKKRIQLFKNRQYPKGKLDAQNKYKYWADIITPRVNAEVKNLRLDTKNFLFFSESPSKDSVLIQIANLRIKEYMRDSNRAEELNENVETFTGDGNVLFKKTKEGYTTLDPLNTIITNECAKTVDETDIIERYEMTQSELRAKEGVWNNIDDVINGCKGRSFKRTTRSTPKDLDKSFYEIFERNGEVTEQELFEAQGKDGGDDRKYVKARIVMAGLSTGTKKNKHILFAESLGNKNLSDIYISAHRGPYKGAFWREGLYELLFDLQVRANEISNQLSRGLEWASKVIFKYSDNTLVQNILTDLQNGDAIKSTDLSQIDVRLRNLDQLIADWNRINEQADKIANSFEVVQGESLPSGTPFRLGMLMDTNANKLFVFLRQKLDIAYSKIYDQWLKKELFKALTSKDIIRLTGDNDMLTAFKERLVENWYIQNLINIGPHTPEIAQMLKETKLQEIEEKDIMIKNESKEVWAEAMPRIHIVITGENTDIGEKMETLANLLQFETDPSRRAYLLDQIYSIKGIKAPPAQPQPQQQEQQRQTSPRPESDLAQMERQAQGI